MLKALLQIVLTILLGYFAQLYFPFWSMAVAAALVALFFRYDHSIASFISGFVAAGLLWYAYAFTLDSENAGLLSSKLGPVFQLSPSLLLLVTGFTGGLIGGLGALTGSLATRLFEKKQG